MKLEDQVVSLELAKRLKELGVKQESLFYWAGASDGYGGLRVIHNNGMKWFRKHNLEIASAFTVAELGHLLNEWPEGYPTDGGLTEADYRATLLITRIMTGTISFPKCSESPPASGNREE